MTRGDTVDGEAPRARAYSQALRHSARVRLLKRAIPLGSALAVALVLAVTLFDPFGRMAGGLSLGPLNLSGTRITMERPRLTGFQKDTRPYEVTATEAAQDVRKPSLVELKTLRARIVMDEAGTVAHLEAATGVFDTQKERLDLRGDVRVRTSAGYDATLASASIDFKAGTVVSKEPVRVGLTGGTIEADSLDISDNGRSIVFAGRVRSVFTDPDAAGSRPATLSLASPARASSATPPPESP